jgi:hypothetical protein
MAEYRCSFCGKRQDQVKKLIAGPKGVAICDECVTLCKEIVDEEFSGMPRSEPAPRRKSWVDRRGGWPFLSLHEALEERREPRL